MKLCKTVIVLPAVIVLIVSPLPKNDYMAYKTYQYLASKYIFQNSYCQRRI